MHFYVIFRCGCCSFLGDTCIGKSWARLRQFVHHVVDNPFFEWTILLLIFASSLSLCFEDINLQDNEELMFILKIVNLVFAVLFFLEMILKWIAFGLWRYFTSAWTCLDFVIVCVSKKKLDCLKISIKLWTIFWPFFGLFWLIFCVRNALHVGKANLIMEEIMSFGETRCNSFSFLYTYSFPKKAFIFGHSTVIVLMVHTLFWAFSMEIIHDFFSFFRSPF